MTVQISEAALDQLANEAWTEAKRRTRLKRTPYIPYGECLNLYETIADEVVISGPAGTGKSRACLEKIHYLMQRYDGARALIVRKTRASLTESALQTFERWVLGAGHPMIQGGTQRRFRHNYLYPNGSEIIVGGIDNPTRIMSTEYDIIFVQEAIELIEGEWEDLSTRLRTGPVPNQSLIGDTNPGPPGHWIKQRCDQGVAALLESRHEDNPRLYDHDAKEWTQAGVVYIARLDKLTGARKQRLRYGKWVQAEGVIYEGYNPKIHLIDRFSIPKDWLRFRVIDFGFTNPFVCHWWAVDGDGRMYMYREIYHTQRTVKKHSKAIKSFREKIAFTVCDHDAEDRATLGENGIPNMGAKKAVSVGIQKVQERLLVAEDKKSRIYLLRDSVVEIDQSLVDAKKPWCTEQEFTDYVWSNKANKEEPVKKDDHGMDALRYAVMQQDSGAADLPDDQPGQASKFLTDQVDDGKSRWKRY